MHKMMEENSKAKRGERVQSLLKSMPQQASQYRANASTTKNTGERALIYGSGLSVTHLKNL